MNMRDLPTSYQQFILRKLNIGWIQTFNRLILLLKKKKQSSFQWTVNRLEYGICKVYKNLSHLEFWRFYWLYILG
jgi:hypothetical protein